MKNSIIALVLLALVSIGWAETNTQELQTPAQPPQATQPAPGVPADAAETNPAIQNLSWMIGEWHGSATQNGQKLETDLSVKPQLDGQALQFERSTPSGYKELMVIAYDKTSQKIVGTIFTSQNNSGIYVGSAAGTKITFAAVSAPQGATNERIIEQTPEGLKLTLRTASAGEQPKPVEITFAKQ